VINNGVYEFYFASCINIIFNELFINKQNKTYTPFYHIIFIANLSAIFIANLSYIFIGTIL